MCVDSTPHEMSLIWGYGLDFFSVIFWTVNELLEPVSKKKSAILILVFGLAFPVDHLNFWVLLGMLQNFSSFCPYFRLIKSLKVTIVEGGKATVR